MMQETLLDAGFRAGFRLVGCDPEGRPFDPRPLPPAMAMACAPTAEFYREHYARVGFVPPWICYVVMDGETVLGGGAFVGPPQDNQVEIAYFTLAEHQGRGVATRTARELIAIAKAAGPGLEVIAKTEPRPNASTAILTRLGFVCTGTTIDHEIGEAWAWALR